MGSKVPTPSPQSRGIKGAKPPAPPSPPRRKRIFGYQCGYCGLRFGVTYDLDQSRQELVSEGIEVVTHCPHCGDEI